MLARIPWRLIGYAALALLLLFGANHAMRFIPFTPQWSAHRAAAKADRLEGQVSTLEREATGNAEIGQAVERHFEREVIVREVTAQAITEARNAPDATTPLSQERADRLRSADFRLCGSFPGLCADADATGSRPDAVPPAGPAR
jgi:hypothetical protein